MFEELGRNMKKKYFTVPLHTLGTKQFISYTRSEQYLINKTHSWCYPEVNRSQAYTEKRLFHYMWMVDPIRIRTHDLQIAGLIPKQIIHKNVKSYILYNHTRKL